MITTTETMEGFSTSPVIINGSSSPSRHSVPSSAHLSNGATATPPKYKPMKKKPSPSHATSVFKGSAITPCTECGKRFHSWKALFGHMRCHPDRPYRGMNMKHQKPKPKPKPKPKSSKLLCGVQEIRNWEHITDGVTRAALILMEMSGQSVKHIVESMKARVDVDSSRLIDTQKKFAKLEIVA